ncbi:MAG: hypothetical protein AAGD11_15815 [Planctomycetota bacterium]
MRRTINTFALILLAAALSGCRSQTATMTNPFLAPDRVPPPATRSPALGTAQPYYPGDPVPNTPVIGTPPGTFTPAGIQTPSTFSPQPAGTVPPGGWNTTPQPIPSGSSSVDRWPTNVQQASANLPSSSGAVVQVQPDQQSLRFTGNSLAPQQAATTTPKSSYLPPDPSILPTPSQPPAAIGVQPNGGQAATLQAAPPIQQLGAATAPIAEPREVRIRAISSGNLSTDGQVLSSDGFRPQGTSEVRKPTLASRFMPQQIEQPAQASSRYGFAPDYTWLRGQLRFSSETNSWSLRYLPSQGSADGFGGELSIANPQALGGLRGGEYVQLRGRVIQPSSAGRALPAYSVAVVQRQRI